MALKSPLYSGFGCRGLAPLRCDEPDLGSEGAGLFAGDVRLVFSLSIRAFDMGVVLD